MEERDRAERFERGAEYLRVARKIGPFARQLEPDDADAVRRLVDRLSERGLELLTEAVGVQKKRRRRTPEEMAAAREAEARAALGLGERE